MGTVHNDRLIKKLDDLWKYIDKQGDDDCWNWLLGTNKTGYGSVRINGIKFAAHRVAYFISKGGITMEAPKDRKGSGFLLHKCDNRLCCNPNHLSIGTYNQNNKDAKEKGRSSSCRGANSPRAKLTNEQAIQLRNLWKNGETCLNLQKIFGLSEKTIYRVAYGNAYKNAGDLNRVW